MTLGDDQRVVVLDQVPSPVNTVPARPGRDIMFPGTMEVSPCSLEGRHAAETLEIQSERRSVSESMRPLPSSVARREPDPSMPGDNGNAG